MKNHEDLRITISIGLSAFLFTLSFFIINYYNPISLNSIKLDILSQFILSILGYFPALIGTSFVVYLILISIEYTVNNKSQKFKKKLKWAHFFYNEGIILLLNLPLFLFFYYMPVWFANVIVENKLIDLDIRCVTLIILFIFILLYFLLKIFTKNKK